MIVGSGSIAKLLNDREGFLFFAAGVSNSKKVDTIDTLRESIKLGFAIDAAKKYNLMFVYFSTISIYTKYGDYVNHKKTMEDAVRTLAPNYSIIRLGNVWECTNKNTFINAIKAKQEKGEEVKIADEMRYMISKDQLAVVTNGLPLTGKIELSIFGEMKTVKQCLKLRS